jgi:RNA polymerase sigma-70 factor (ECF subfamily)
MGTIAGRERNQLLARARGGSKEALGTLLEDHAPYLALLARVQIGRQLQGKADPQDLVQETFVAAQSSFSEFRGSTEAEFASWLRQILAAELANLVRRYIGTKGRDVRLERELSHDLDHSSQILDQGLVAAQTSPSQQASRREQAVVLARALSRLPEDYREVLILRHLEELPFAEVAQRMGRSVDSVEKLWLRALGRIRRSMEADS